MTIPYDLNLTADYQQAGGGSLYAVGYILLENGPADIIVEYGAMTGVAGQVSCPNVAAGQYTLSLGSKNLIRSIQFRAANGQVSSPAQHAHGQLFEPHLPSITPVGTGAITNVSAGLISPVFLNLNATLNRANYVGNAFVYNGSQTSYANILSEVTDLGTSPAGPSVVAFGFFEDAADDPTVHNVAVTGAANNGSGLIRLTAVAHGFSTGDSVGVYGVTGTTEANGQWLVTFVDANHIDLQGSAFVNPYVAGGTVTNRGSMYGGFFAVSPRVTRAGLTGTAQNGDDVVGVGVFNGGSGTATAAFNVNRNSGFGAGTEFFTGLEIEANVSYGMRIISAVDWGVDFYGDGFATYAGGPIRLPNNSSVYGRNTAGSADLALFRVRSGTDDFELLQQTRLSGQVFVSDGINFDLGTTNGTKIGNATAQKLGFYGVTPVARQLLATGAGHTVDDVITFLQTVGLCRQT